MQTKLEFRRSERFIHEYIIQLGEDLTLSPYYAVSRNLIETGMYFKSVFELHSGPQIRIVINDKMPGQNQVYARVVWCTELKNTNTFRDGVGVEFLQAQINSGSTASLPIAPHMKSPGKQDGGTVIQLSKRSSEQKPARNARRFWEGRADAGGKMNALKIAAIVLIAAGVFRLAYGSFSHIDQTASKAARTTYNWPGRLLRACLKLKACIALNYITAGRC